MGAILQQDAEWLLTCEPFHKTDIQCTSALLDRALPRAVKPGEVLTAQGVVPEELYIVRSGSLLATNPSTGEILTLGPGSVVNAEKIFLNEPSAVTITVFAPFLDDFEPPTDEGAPAAASAAEPDPAAPPAPGLGALLWAVPAARFRELVASRADLAAGLAQRLAGELGAAQREAELARKRSRALAPYLVTAPKHGIIGSSKYAERLRKQVVECARDKSRQPVLIFGEPGLEKSNIAALVHFGGPGRGSGPMAALDCAALDGSGADLFGRGDKAGLLELVGKGTLLLKNVHKMPPALLPKLQRLVTEGSYRPARTPAPGSGSGPTPPPASSLEDLEGLPALRCAFCRIIMTASRQVPQLETACKVIKVPPLRLRPADVKDLQRFYLKQVQSKLALQGSEGEGGAARLAVTPAALRQLEAYTWPGNISEVAVVVERAVLQAADGPGPADGRLNEEVFWFAKQAKDRFRLNLLAAWPPLRPLLRSSLWPNDINFKFTAIIYPLIVALLLWGPQDRLHNPALTVFWDCWWPLVFLSYPFLGRVWCAVCPFMIYGELAQAWRTSGGAQLLKWPREQAERYGPPFLFGLFAAILVWEEVWDLPHTAALSGWLLILITAGAVVCSSIFERRLWCRYLCPIGGMNGLFAKLSMTEVRARQGVCSGECSTYHCYKGGCAEPPDGLESPGCPLYSHPAQLTDNRNCVNCMECLKACPNGSVEFRLRWPGADLWFPGHTPSYYEVALSFMLLGAVYLHTLPALCGQLGLDAATLGLTAVTPQHIAASVGVLAAPGCIAWAADALSRAASPTTGRPLLQELYAAVGRGVGAAVAAVRPSSGSAGGGVPAAAGVAGASVLGAVGQQQEQQQGAGVPAVAAPFLYLAYGYVPLVWAGTLAHYLEPLLGEAGKLLPITAAMVGWEDAQLPVAVAHPAVISFLQGGMLLFGAAASAILSRRIGGQPWAAIAPQVATIGLFTAELWALTLHG